MITFLTVLHVFVCLFLILVVLLQAGKGGGMGIAFGGGGGGSQTVFGSSGAGNFLTRLTSVTAFLFLLTSLGLAHFSSQQDSKRLQRLAERKTVEKKAEDQRASKLKMDLEKARESIQTTTKTGTPTAPAFGTAPAAAETAPAAAATKPAEATTKPAAVVPPTPRRRKHAVAPPADGTAAPAGASDSPPPPAPAPAP
jgi:preprotein translocase subunit SecG